jgi:hypothetical protein
MVTDGHNDLTSTERAAIANEGLNLMTQLAEQAVAAPPAMPGPPLAAPGVGIWDLGAVLAGLLAGGAPGGIGVLFVLPASAVVGEVIAELAYRNCPC